MIMTTYRERRAASLLCQPLQAHLGPGPLFSSFQAWPQSRPTPGPDHKAHKDHSAHKQVEAVMTRNMLSFL